MGYGFARSHTDYSSFTYSKNDVYMALLVYVDDMVLTGNNSSACNEFEEYLNHCLHIKDLGQLKHLFRH